MSLTSIRSPCLGNLWDKIQTLALQNIKYFLELHDTLLVFQVHKYCITLQMMLSGFHQTVAAWVLSTRTQMPTHAQMHITSNNFPHETLPVSFCLKSERERLKVIKHQWIFHIHF